MRQVPYWSQGPLIRIRFVYGSKNHLQYLAEFRTVLGSLDGAMLLDAGNRAGASFAGSLPRAQEGAYMIIRLNSRIFFLLGAWCQR